MAAPSVESQQNARGNADTSHLLRRAPSMLDGILLTLFFLRGAVGWCMGFLAGFIPTRERRLATLQLKLFLPEVNTAMLTPRIFANLGRVALESISLRTIVRNRYRLICCSNWDTVERWKRDERPIITLTAHTGNWDLLAAYVIAQGIPLTTIGREARSRYAQYILRWIRSSYGIETVWRSDKTGLKRLMQCLKERRVIAALIDQDTRVESIHVPFFGKPAKTPVSLIRLGKKHNARFVSAFLFRTGWFRYSVFVDELPDSPDEYEILGQYSQRLETYIRRYPEQWVWFHKRWRTTPEGSTLSSDEYLNQLKEQILKR